MVNKVLQMVKIRKWKNHLKLLQNKAIIGENFRYGMNCDIYNESGEKETIVLGHHCRLDGFLFCKSSGRIEIGNYSWIGKNVHIQCLNHIKIGHYVGIGENTFIMDNSGHATEPEERVKHRIRIAPGGPGYPGHGDGSELSESTPIVIENAVWIEANSLIIRGVTIGEGSIVTRNSVVTRDVPANSIVTGNPARVVQQLKKPDRQYY
jgi:acetyltransferase-like isoleucine patch superfamily enzyme